MKKTIILTIVALFLAIGIVNATPLEQGRIISKDIITNHGTLIVEPTIIVQTINAGETINKEIKIDLTTDLTKEFKVTLLKEGEISGWINFEGENLIIKKGENFINIIISVPSNAETKRYTGFIVMNNEDIDYNLVDIFLDVKSNEDDLSGNSNNGGSSSGGCITKWICTEWSDCINETQKRTCEKEKSYCYAGQKPDEERTCDENETGNQNGETGENNTFGNGEEKQNFVSGITGAVIGTLGTTGTTIVGIFLAGLISSAIAVKIIRKRRLRISKN